MQLPGGYDKRGPQPAIAVNAEHFQPFAAVRPAAAAGVTVRVIDVRFDRAPVTGSHVRNILPDFKHLDAQFMSGNPRVAEKRHFAQVAADVRATDAHAMNSNQSFARSRLGWLRKIHAAELLRCFEGYCFHTNFRLVSNSDSSERSVLFRLTQHRSSSYICFRERLDPLPATSGICVTRTSSLGGIDDPKLHPPPLVAAKDALEFRHSERTAVDHQNRTVSRSIPVNVTAKNVVA
jgi:hypothetical protein